MNWPLAPYYRSFRLWDLDAEQERSFRRLWMTLLAIGVVLALIVSLVPVPERASLAQPTIPPRLAKIVIEREAPPPPPPPPPVEQEKKPEVEQPRPEPQPEQRREQARRRAEAQLASVRDELASIRESLAMPVTETRNLTGSVGAQGRAERSLITSRAGTGSSGVVSAGGGSRGFGSGAGNLAEHSTGTVQSAVASAAATAATVSRGSSGKPGRSAEEIEQEFERNRSAIYSLYLRALRERADLQGKVVLEFTIAPEGNVTACRVLSSELDHPELENRICARVRGFRFAARDVAAVTTTKPIDFLPQG
jgi:TonB family protein